jgi:hypothetical protein
MRAQFALALLCVLAVTGSCYLGTEGLACDATHACPDPFVCDGTQHCVPPASLAPDDAGQPDGGSPDGGSHDGGSDAGPACDAETNRHCPNDQVCSLAATCTGPRYEMADGVVADNVTGLHWQQVLPANPCPSDNSGSCTWEHAKSYCQALNLGGHATGWRAPTLPELFSLVDTGANPAIDSTAFPGTPGAWFWTSDCYPNSACADVWDVEFTQGNTEGNAAPTSMFYIRCVR